MKMIQIAMYKVNREKNKAGVALAFRYSIQGALLRDCRQ
jgi:hypothetical protein